MSRLVRYSNLIMAALAFGCAAFIVAMVLAAIYLPVPRDMHLPAPADKPRRI